MTSNDGQGLGGLDFDGREEDCWITTGFWYGSFEESLALDGGFTSESPEFKEKLISKVNVLTTRSI